MILRKSHAQNCRGSWQPIDGHRGRYVCSVCRCVGYRARRGVRPFPCQHSSGCNEWAVTLGRKRLGRLCERHGAEPITSSASYYDKEDE